MLILEHGLNSQSFSMTTPHNEAAVGDYAAVVLMPGDPLRAKWIAETYFDNPVLVNSIRNCLGYTGTYKGRSVSVQASGMGQPSLGIYVHELYNIYNVESIVRVGSCGSIAKDLELGDIVVATSAVTDSAMMRNIEQPCADLDWVQRFVRCLPAATPHKLGTMVSSDYFYQPDSCWWQPLLAQGILAVDMETHLLYALAAKFNKRAMSVNTVSDCVNSDVTPMAAIQRQTGFDVMVRAVLESIV